MNIEEYLRQHQKKELLRFITCGSVDDGKSTLIGRLLYDTKVIFEDQIAQAKNETKKYGTVKDEEIDFALLVDGLQSEREQGITIDVAYRFFSTNKRKYIIADTPGHEQYTRNMVTGASTADLAVILIDARKGVLTQTRRHSFLVTLLGIRNILVAVNKMDLVDYSKEVFEKIKRDYLLMFKDLRVSLPYKKYKAQVDFIPISALKGDNVVEKSPKTPWFEGLPLLTYLDTVKVLKSEFEAFRYPIQYVNRPNLDFRGFSGTISSGEIKEGEKIIIYPSKKTSTIKKIIPPLNPETNLERELKRANAPMAITLTLTDEIDISRGDLMVKENQKPPKFNDSFEAMLVWMDEEPLKNREYILKIYTKEVPAIVSKILFKRDVNSWEKIEAKTLELNDIARVQVDLGEKVAFDLYEENQGTGAFILIDKVTNNTVAAGMVVGESTKRAKKRIYTESEIALNRFIRQHFPEWECKAIEEIE
ncbi:MAG: sulfate adenylyltransferase subunit CysN [Epsilonproteobacteria bacterium]|nr:sulfate adenylyltransferase subunit CysN [Campylobacterota bacterium]